MEENDFKIGMRHADNLYTAGKWEAAMNAASAALEAANKTSNEENSADALNRRGWSARYVGFKSDNPEVKKEMYENARRDWKEVLNISKNLKTRISAIKGLILLPNAKIEILYAMGMEEIKRNQQDLENLEAELMNSKAIEIRKTDQVRAFNMFEDAYKIVRRGTVIAGHLKQNAGTCWLMLLKEEKDLYRRELFAHRAIKNLKEALNEYPSDQTEHRKSTEKKLANAEEELKQLEKTKAEKK